MSRGHSLQQATWGRSGFRTRAGLNRKICPEIIWEKTLGKGKCRCGLCHGQPEVNEQAEPAGRDRVESTWVESEGNEVILDEEGDLQEVISLRINTNIPMFCRVAL